MSFRREPIPAKLAHQIYDVVVEQLPLKEHPDDLLDGMCHWRYSFVQYATEGTWVEYRIGGPLGFGGKLWNNAGRWYVSCYSEDKNPEREEAVARTNAALDKLWESTYGAPPRSS